MLLSSSDTRRTLMHSCLQLPPRENWFQYVRRVYSTAINFPCIITLFETYIKMFILLRIFLFYIWKFFRKRVSCLYILANYFYFKFTLYARLIYNSVYFTPITWTALKKISSFFILKGVEFDSFSLSHFFIKEGWLKGIICKWRKQ